MDPATLIPTPDPLQVPWGWFQLLLTITIFLHILLMNMMLGGAFIAFARHLTHPEDPGPLTRMISRRLPFTIAFTVNFGVAPLLFVQVLYGHFMYTSSILMASFWLLIIALLIAAYYLAYIYSYRYESMQMGRTVTVGLSLLLLLLIGFFITSNFVMMMLPDSWVRYFDQPGGTLLIFSDPTIVPRYLHFVISSVAVGGLAIAFYYTLRPGKDREQASTWIRYGCTWFGGASILNFGIGFWFFGSLPPGTVDLSSTTGILITVCLLAGMVLAGLAIIQAFRIKVLPATWLILGSIFTMLLARDLLRAAYLKPWFSVGDLPVTPQYSPMIVFLLFFVAGLALLAWMAHLACRGSGQVVATGDKEERS
ncbi:hypothetical protein GF1_26380 [Desulfolithobacter dissulfuricans]|uniref:Uncharacterized protein n=1 Tax=Desulfolithobacter dissulfuricans TaxID=2795293 RepID=A0A915U410_9BACT|nr:hypothetical protein [Desulfolithobacter dissulfuricans]BCO10262.1 hypothetical protein GF1_26380 [Desulfolithobacter dissulfuricans]